MGRPYGLSRGEGQKEAGACSHNLNSLNNPTSSRNCREVRRLVSVWHPVRGKRRSLPRYLYIPVDSSKEATAFEALLKNGFQIIWWSRRHHGQQSVKFPLDVENRATPGPRLAGRGVHEANHRVPGIASTRFCISQRRDQMKDRQSDSGTGLHGTGWDD